MLLALCKALLTALVCVVVSVLDSHLRAENAAHTVRRLSFENILFPGTLYVRARVCKRKRPDLACVGPCSNAFSRALDDVTALVALAARNANV